MIPYSTEENDEEDMKHSLKKVGKTLVFSVRDLMADDAGLYQVDVEEVNMFTTDFKSKALTSACFFKEKKINLITVYRLYISYTQSRLGGIPLVLTRNAFPYIIKKINYINLRKIQ